MSSEFLFNHENEAIYCDKCSDDEPPCWNISALQRHCDWSANKNSVRIIGQYDVTIASGSCVDDAAVTPLFLFTIVSGRLGMNGVIFVYYELYDGWKYKYTVVLFNGEYHKRL